VPSIWIASTLLVVAALTAVRVLKRRRRRRIREGVVADVRAAIEPWLKPELAEKPPPTTEPPTTNKDRHRLVLGSNDEPSSPRNKWVS
jgi:hypothetical protein